MHALQVGRKPRLRGNILERAIAPVAVEPGACPVGKENVAPAVIIVVGRHDPRGRVLHDAELLGEPLRLQEHRIVRRAETFDDLIVLDLADP